MKRLAAAALAVALAAPLACGERFDPTPYLAAAARYDVRILRDPWGVPHVYGARDADVAYGLAYAHCEDDFATIQSVALATRGELAAHAGRDAAPVDYLVRLLGIWEAVEARYESDLRPATRAVVEAYAAGVNHYAALHPEERIDALLPMTGKDVVAGFALKVPFFYGLDDQIRRIVDGELEGLPSETAVARYIGAGIGSNAVAVSPRRSADGATRLLVNSHQPMTGPVSWYEIRLKSDEGWNVAGGTFPGGPVMLHGHNRHLGWANTVNRPDLADVYALEIDPDDRDRYRLDGEWHRLERREVGITVKLLGPLRWTFQREVLRSRHGPVLRSDQGTFAIRYAGMEEIRSVEQLLRLNRATDFESWRDALAMLAMPSTNYVYADHTGRIAYFYNARFPRRPEGFDWSGVLPGDRSDLIWDDHHPLSDVPQIVDPDSGLLVNANHTPFRATVGDGNPRPDDFPASMGIETGLTNRALRELELYGRDAAVTREAFRRYKFDHRYSDRSDAVAVVDALLALEPGDDPLLARAQEVLRAWDRSASRDSRSAALALRTAAPIVRARRRGQPVPDPRALLLDTAHALERDFGRLDPPWGEVNRLRRGDVDLPVAGGPDTLRAIEGEPDADGRLRADGGDGLIVFVEWDAAGRLHSESIHHFGAAMGRPESPHHADQAPLFAAERTTPVLFDEAALRAAGARAYRPGE